MREPRARRGIALVLGLAVLLAGCTNPGPYPADIFPEMHYQKSYRLLEPERRAPPQGAVPITGVKPRLTFADAGSLSNPLTLSEETRELGRARFATNCITCHGPVGRGDGLLAQDYGRNPAVTLPPTDLASQRVQQRTDGQLYWLVRHGIGGMPAFDDLLTDQELWAIVVRIRELQAR